MSTSLVIRPAILTESVAEFLQQFQVFANSAVAEVIHVDVIDGQFADVLTVTPLDLTVIDFGHKQIDFHLMVEEPMDFVFEAEALADYLPIRRIYGQIERMSYQSDFLTEVRRSNWQAGLALDIYTPLESIDINVWPELDNLLLMAVEAGHQTQIFNNRVVEKVAAARAQAKRPLDVTVDGGVKRFNIRALAAANVNEVAVGSELWQSSDPLRMIAELQQISETGQLSAAVSARSLLS